MWNWVAELEEHRRAGQPLALVTVAHSSGSTPRDLGARMLVLPDGRISGTIGGGNLEFQAIKDALGCLKSGESRAIKYPLGAKTGQCCGGVVDLLIEPLNAGPRLYLFGAGHVAQAICKTLSGTPFAVHLIDDRLEWVEAPGLPSEVIRFRGDWDEFAVQARWDAENTYVAIMTHRHDLDLAIVDGLLAKPCRYLGLIGSAAKWARFRQRLLNKGVSEETLGRVRSPVGLRLGGKAPQEIAISFAAELLRLHYAEAGAATDKSRESLPRASVKEALDVSPR
jgi:xanthine dehydrogenase accessory factor